MATWTNSAEGGTSGVAASSANTGGASGDAFTSFNGTGVFEFLTGAAAHGSMGYLMVPTSATIREGRVDLTADPTVHFVGYWQRKAAATAAHTILQLRSSSALMATISISSSTQRLIVNNSAGTNIFGTADSLTAVDTWYRIELKVTKGTGTGDGVCEFRLYVGESTTPQATFSSSTVNMGTADFTNMRIGRPSGTTTDVTAQWWDSMRLFTNVDLPVTMANPWPTFVGPAEYLVWSGTEWLEALSEQRKLYNGTIWV